jgi:hypothetical protein
VSRTSPFLLGVSRTDSRPLRWWDGFVRWHSSWTVVRAPYTALRRAIFTHPTTAEGLDGLFANPPLAPAPRETVSDSGNTRRQASLVSAPGKE